MDMVDLIKKAACFQKLDLDRLMLVAKLAHFVEQPAETPIFAAGDTHRLLYIVQEGRVAIRVDGPSGKPATLTTVGPSEIFGWSAFVPPHSKTASAISLEPVKLIAIDAQGLRELCEQDSEIGYRVCDWLNHLVAERLYAMRLRLHEILPCAAEDDGWVLAFP